VQQETEGPIRFAGFTLDLARGRLLGDEGDVPLRPKSFAFLSHMARNAGRVVSKDELLSAIWPEVIVTEDSLTRCVHEVRKALGPTGPAVLRTVPRRGYLFQRPMVEPTTARWQPAQATDVNPAIGEDSSAGAGALRRDGIAVLPFSLSAPADPSDALLLDGLAHDVISRLARLRSFHVIARGSTFALRHLAADPVAAGRALDVAYAVAGSAAIRGKQIALRIEIVDVSGRSVLWTHDFAEDRAAFSDLIAELVDQIVQTVDMQVTAAEMHRVRSMPVEALDAWEVYHSALPLFYSTDPSVSGQAVERFERAIRLAPDFARAHAMKAACHYVRAFVGRGGERVAEAASTRRSAEDALEADDQNPASHMAYGMALWLERDLAGCMTHLKSAIALSPGFARGHSQIAAAETLAGDAARGLAHIDKALALNPRDVALASMQVTKAFALHRLGRVEEAAIWARNVARHRNTFGTILAPAALILASAGRLAEAREIAAGMRASNPQYESAAMQYSLSGMSDELGALFAKDAPRIGL
jgi:DNA-binding winged helix-turn-helix (wHTH) protein